MESTGIKTWKPEQCCFTGVAERNNPRGQKLDTQKLPTIPTHLTELINKTPQRGVDFTTAAQHAFTEQIFIMRVNKCSSFSLVLVVTSANSVKKLVRLLLN